MTVQVRKFIAGEGWDEDSGKPLFCVRVYLGKRAGGGVSRLSYYKRVQAAIHYNLWEMDDGWFCGGDYLNKQDAEDMAEKVRDICRKSRGDACRDNESSIPDSAGRPEAAGHPKLHELSKLSTSVHVY